MKTRKVSARGFQRSPGPLQNGLRVWYFIQPLDVEESTETAQGSIVKLSGVSFELTKVYPKSLVQRERRKPKRRLTGLNLRNNQNE